MPLPAPPETTLSRIPTTPGDPVDTPSPGGPVESPAEFDGLPLSVEFRDALSGAILPVRDVRLRTWDPGRTDPGALPETPLREEGGGHAMERSPLLPGAKGTWDIVARLPDGYAPESKEGMLLRGTVSPFASRVRGTVLVWPEARILLRVVEEDGSPVPGAAVITAKVAGGLVEVRGDPTNDFGEAVVRGVPALEGEEIILFAGREDRGAESAPGRLPPPGGELPIRVVLPREPAWGLETGRGVFFEGRTAGHRNLIAGETGSLRVTVVRRDGRPATGVSVRVGGSTARTNKYGVARFEHLRVGRREVFASAPGFVAESAEVWIGLGVEATVELLEGEGYTGTVQVLDEEDRPVAGVTLEVVTEGGIPWCHMEGEVQVMGLHTGPDGRRALPHLPPGPVLVRATLGSRSGKGTVEGTGTTVIRLPPAK